jgi:hypothetical protein
MVSHVAFMPVRGTKDIPEIERGRAGPSSDGNHKAIYIEAEENMRLTAVRRSDLGYICHIARQHWQIIIDKAKYSSASK